MQCEECVHFIDVSSGEVTATSTNAAPSKTPEKQSSECESLLLCSHTLVGIGQSSDSFSALGTLRLDKRVANAHTQWDFPFQA